MKKLVLILLLIATPAFAVELTWDKNAETDLASYKIYYADHAVGPDESYGHSINVGLTKTPLTPKYSFQPDIPCGTGERLIFYVVTAFNTAGKESKPSNQVSHIEALAPCAPQLNEIIAAIKSLLQSAKISTTLLPNNGMMTTISF